jgi:hypothetical protein
MTEPCTCSWKWLRIHLPQVRSQYHPPASPLSFYFEVLWNQWNVEWSYAMFISSVFNSYWVFWSSRLPEPGLAFRSDQRTDQLYSATWPLASRTYPASFQPLVLDSFLIVNSSFHSSLRFN